MKIILMSFKRYFSMYTKVIIVLLVYLIQTVGYSQTIVGGSQLDIRLKRNEVKTLFLVLEKGDKVGINIKSTTWVSQTIKNPESQVISELSVKSGIVRIDYNAKEDGVYELSLQNMSRIFSSKVDLFITKERKVALNGDTCKRKVVSERSEQVLTNGLLSISSVNEKKYSYNLQQGDTIRYYIEPKDNKLPAIEISSDKGEIFYTSFPENNKLDLCLPIHYDGSYTLSLSTKSLLTKKDSIFVSLISPITFEKCEFKNIVDSVITPVVIPPIYDTISYLVVDTVVFLGARRDPINKNSGVLKFDNSNPDLLFWGVFYGAGKEFKNNLDHYSIILEREALAAGVNDLLSAHGLGFIKKLPVSRNNSVKFGGSPSIINSLTKTKSNYAIINGAPQNEYLSFENMSEVSGQKVYAYVVFFMRELRVE